MLQQAAVLFETKRKMYYNIIDKSIEPDPNGAYLRDIVLIFKEPMATEAHGIFTVNVHIFRGYLQ